MTKLLPQANTLDTVIKAFVYASNKKNCTLQDISLFCGFTDRQASYYTSACHYLNLLDENMKPTDLGNAILADMGSVRVKIYELVMNDDLVGRIFHNMLLYPKDAIRLSREWVASRYPEYGNAVIERRTQCLMSWCQEIIDYIK